MFPLWLTAGSVIFISAAIRLSLPSADNLFDYSVKGSAMAALYPQKVPIPVRSLCLAIIAHYVNGPLQIRRHGMFCNITSSCLPSRRHGLRRNHGFLAYRTTIVEACQLAKTMSVNCVTTGQVVRRLTRGKHIFPANRAIVFVLILEATVRIEGLRGYTHRAFTTMAEVFLSAHSTKAALIAMKGIFILTHPKVAFAAVILSENFLTIYTLI